MDKLDGMSMDIEQTEKDKLQSLFPQCFKEGKLDIDMLLNLCGEYIDEDFEKYKFEWKGKAECFRIAGKRSTGTLRPAPDESVNFDTTKNLYIEGDNLEVLKLLQTAYFRKVKMIYIDPPYNTGNDFVYNDDFSDPIAHYKEITSQATKSNPESMGRFHTAWLNMMYPRLRLAANLLRDDGVIFISIDDNEVRNLRMLCDEVFGEENFVAQLIWERAYSPKNDAKYISNSHDYVLMYAKHIEQFQIGRLPRTDEANARYTNPDNDPRGVWKPSDMSVKTYTPENDYPITAPSGRVVEPPAGRCWRLSKNAFFERLQDNRIWFGTDGNSVPSIKRFLTELKFDGMAPTSIMFYKDVGHSQEGAKEVTALLEAGAFDGPKPVRLLSRLLTLANTDSDSIILDFFSGSATTAHAVMQMNAEDGGNRRFIMAQIPAVTEEKSEALKSGFMNICEIGKERIRRAGAKVLTEWQEKQTQLEIGEQSEQSPPDIGFKVLKLDTSNLHAWDGTPISDGNMQTLWDRFDAREKTIKKDRSDLDIVYEVMLKMGIHFDYVASEITVGGRKCYSIGERPFETSKDCMILVCLDFGITPEDITAFCDLAPAKIIAAEEAFEDSTAMSNAHYILKDRDIEMKLL